MEDDEKTLIRNKLTEQFNAKVDEGLNYERKVQAYNDMADSQINEIIRTMRASSVTSRRTFTSRSVDLDNRSPSQSILMADNRENSTNLLQQSMKEFRKKFVDEQPEDAISKSVNGVNTSKEKIFKDQSLVEEGEEQRATMHFSEDVLSSSKDTNASVESKDGMAIPHSM